MGIKWCPICNPSSFNAYFGPLLHESIFFQVIKNKFTGEPASYGFINFDSDPAALMAMHKLNGKIIPNSTPVSPGGSDLVTKPIGT